MKTLEQLIKDIQSGEMNIGDLTLEESEAVLEGYKQIAEHLIENEDTLAVGEAILEVLSTVIDNDPFEASIEAAEARGSTYWDLETNSIH